MPSLTRLQWIAVCVAFGSVILVTVGIAAFVLEPVLDPSWDRRVVTSILHLQETPPSLRILGMESPFTTDVSTTCSIEIDPEQFPLLLAGHDYRVERIQGTSHSLPVNPDRVGPVFDVTTSFSMLAPYEVVKVYANESRTRALVTYWKE